MIFTDISGTHYDELSKFLIVFFDMNFFIFPPLSKEEIRKKWEKYTGDMQELFVS